MRYVPLSSNAVHKPLRRIDDGVHQIVLAFKSQRVFAVHVVEPRLVAELDRQRVAGTALNTLRDMLA